MDLKAEIKVDRAVVDGNLIFTISCLHPNAFYQDPHDWELMHTLEKCKEEILLMDESIIKSQIHRGVHKLQEDIFFRMQKHILFAIEESLRPRFDHMCQEIYNHIYDTENGKLKEWMQAFDPQRTKYYFDNDAKQESHRDSNEICDDKIDDDDEDDDMEDDE